MSKAIITTTGTSFLTNALKYWEKSREYKSYFDIKEEDFRQFILDKKNRGKGGEISAEINTLEKLKENDILNKNDIVHLVVSDTKESEKVIHYLKSIIEDMNLRFQWTKIENLRYDENRFQVIGLRNFINTLVKLIEKYRGQSYEVIINATGGFKAEIAYATVVAQLMKVEVYYMHEKFRDIIQMPYLPLNFDIEYWGRYENIFKKFEKGVNDKELETLLKSVPQNFKFLIYKDEVDNIWRLNPAGETFYLSFLEAKTIYLKEIDEKKVFIKKGESTLWNAINGNMGSIESLNDIPDKEVIKLLERILKFSFVKKIELVDYHNVGKGSGETHLEFISVNTDTPSHYVSYNILCKAGKQKINILVEPNTGELLKNMIGTKVYL